MRKLIVLLSLLCGVTRASAWQFETGDFADPDTANPHDLNIVHVPSQPASPARLLLFFPGTGASMAGYERFLQQADSRGYYVIGLAYRNENSPSSMCGCMASCMGKLEEQNVRGVDNGFYSADDPAVNSVKYRLGALIDYLDAHGIGGVSWSQFWYAPGDHPYWSKIVVAGHSGGGNMATWMLKNNPVVGAITFSAPSTILSTAQPPASMASLTPYAVGGPNGTCSPVNDTPAWVTSGWGGHLLVYDDSRDGAYTGSWAGRNIPMVVNAIGGLTELDFHDGGTPSGRWITRIDNTTGCAGTNPHHNEPVQDCGLDHHGVWNYLLDKALTF